MLKLSLQLLIGLLEVLSGDVVVCDTGLVNLFALKSHSSQAEVCADVIPEPR